MTQCMKSFLALVLTLLWSLSSALAAESYTGSQVLEALPSSSRSELVQEFQSRGISEGAIRRVELSVDHSSLEMISLRGSDPLLVVRDPLKELTESEQIFIGVRLGFPLVLGFHATYLKYDLNHDPNYHVDLEASTILFINSVSLAFGKNLGASPFFAGLRVHFIHLQDLIGATRGGHSTLGLSPELGGVFAVGRGEWGLLSVKLGAIGYFEDNNEFQLTPDFRVGFAVKVFGE